jgi:hypothetical protein
MSIPFYAGGVNFENILKRFSDLGFNDVQCIQEIIDNSIDVTSSKHTTSAL